MKVEKVLRSFDTLGSRCQNGNFHMKALDIEGRLDGKSGYRRAGGEETAAGDDSGGRFTATEEVSVPTPTPAPHPDDTPAPKSETADKETDTITDTNLASKHKPKHIVKVNQRQHTRDIVRRTPNFGDLIGKYEGPVVNHQPVLYRLFRASHFIHRTIPFAGAYTVSYSLFQKLESLVHTVFVNTADIIGRTGIAQPAGGGVDAFTVAMQLGEFSNWREMVQSQLKGRSEELFLMTVASVKDFMSNKYTGAVYHIYNEHNEVLVTLMLNAMGGHTGPFGTA